MVRPRISLTVVISLLVGSWADVSLGQVATAPLRPDQRVTNPAALTYRVLRGHSLHANSRSEIAKDLSGNGGELITKTESLGLNSSGSWGVLSFESNLLPQRGQETITSKSQNPTSPTDQNDFRSDRTINLIPAQAAVSAKLGNWGSAGFKAFYAGSKFQTNEKYANSTAGTDENGLPVTYYDSFSTVGDRSSNILSMALGTILKLGDSDFYFGLSIENLTFNDDINSVRTSTSTIVGSSTTTNTTTTPIVANTKKEIRKDTIGIGYLRKFGGNEVFRSDLSYETMPALRARNEFGSEFSKGELLHWVTEATWSYFHVGVQVTSTSGFYVDPFDYIPYLLGSSNLNGKNVLGYGFFGGLKSSKGHSFGVSYFRSNEMKDKFFANSTPTKLDTTTTSFGLSYAWIF